MAKLLPLQKDDFLPRFREVLRGGPSLGPLLARESFLEAGTLHVWVPDATDSVQPENLRYDLLNDPKQPISFGMTQVEPEVFLLFSHHLSTRSGSLVIADTFYDKHHLDDWEYLRSTRAASLSWFSCDSPRKPEAQQICLYLAASQGSDTRYEELLRDSSQYPATIILTSLPSSAVIESGQYVPPATMQLLVCSVEYVLLGVFDEISFMLWRRKPVHDHGDANMGPRGRGRDDHR